MGSALNVTIDDPRKMEHLLALDGATERLHLFKADFYRKKDLLILWLMDVGICTHGGMDEKEKLLLRRDWIEHVPPWNGLSCTWRPR